MNSHEAQQQILRFLAQFTGVNRITDTQIAQQLGLDLWFVCANLSVLEKKGLIEAASYNLEDDGSTMEASISNQGRLMLHDQDQAASTPTSAMPDTVDAYSPYEVGLDRLVGQLGHEHPRLSEALLFQARLQENIRLVRFYGDNPVITSDRNQVLDQLNRLALETLQCSFNSLCSAAPAVSQSTQQQRQERLEAAVLAFIQGANKRESGSFDYEALADSLGIDHEELEDLVLVLAEKQQIKLYLGGDAVLTPYGRTVLRAFRAKNT